ncbi:pentatricopeptide repeat-containing protein [Tanacetum coccineum]
MDLLLSSFFVSLNPFPFPIIPDLVIVSEVTHFAGVFSYVSVLMDVVFGRQVHCVGVKVGRFRDVFVGISLLNVYCKCKEMWDARKAMWLFKEVVTSVLSAFVLSEFVGVGRSIHCLGFKYGFLGHVSVGNAIVNMYSKCGILDEAVKAFEKALELFSKMHANGLVASEFTLVGVINACSDGSAVGEETKAHAYSIKLGFQHQIYIMTALVDMYAKCGNLDDARKKFDHLQEPDIVLWTSMMGGYVQNGENESAMKSAPIDHVLCLWRRPQDVERVRHMMNLRGVIKEPGCSWIELKSHFHVFVVGDQLHPQIKEIRMEVHRLSKLMKDEGYHSESDSNFADLEV